MIIKPEISNKEVVGDVSSQHATIDVSDLDFILHILSTNLYSNPIESTVRELTTNAWDANADNNSTQPIILSVNTDTQQKPYFYVRDFGAGMSPETFANIYTKFGKSTKRNDNNTHGGFGIGKFSPLSYTENVFVTTWHGGIEYQYLMTKSGSVIDFNLLIEQPSDEPSGTKIKILLKSSDDKRRFIEAVYKQLYFFDQLYLDTDEKGIDFNDRTFTNFNSFIYPTTNQPTGRHILVGKVLYPCDSVDLDFAGLAKADVVKIDIGAVDVTPNRENLQYTRKTVLAIQEAIKTAREEKMAYIEKALNNLTMLDFYNMVKEPNGILKLSTYATPCEYLPESFNATIDGENVVLKRGIFSDIYRNKVIANSGIPAFLIYSNRLERKHRNLLRVKEIIQVNALPTKPKHKAYLRSIASPNIYDSTLVTSMTNYQAIRDYARYYLRDAWSSRHGFVLSRTLKRSFLNTILAQYTIKTIDLEAESTAYSLANRSTSTAGTRVTTTDTAFAATPLRISTLSNNGYVKEKQITVKYDSEYKGLYMTYDELEANKDYLYGVFNVYIVTKGVLDKINKVGSANLLTTSKLPTYTPTPSEYLTMLRGYAYKYNLLHVRFHYFNYNTEALTALKYFNTSQIKRISEYIDYIGHDHGCRFDYGLIKSKDKNKLKYVHEFLNKPSVIIISSMYKKLRENLIYTEQSYHSSDKQYRNNILKDYYTNLFKQEFKALLNKNNKL